MYESFYGLKEKPFNLLPDPDYLYMSKSHDNAYTHLEYAIYENKGFVVVTGEVGSGKTTLINYLLNKIPQDINVGLINNTYIPADQVLKVVCQEYELGVTGCDRAELTGKFQDFLLDQFARQKRVVLFIDEAQNLSITAMEEVRLISNLEAEKHHLIQIILVGQPELKIKLQRKELRQFAQRVSVHCHLKGLDNGEVDRYIKHRLNAAGASQLNIFHKSAVELISEYSKGIPRVVNVLCDTALVYGFADEKKIIDKQILNNVIEAREAGGILSGELAVEEEDQGGAIVERTIQTRDPDYGLCVHGLEKRIELVENMVVNIDHRINQLVQKRDDRDQVVIELFQMLKGSIENRLTLVAKFNQLVKQIELQKTQLHIKKEDKEKERKKGRSSPGKYVLWVLGIITAIIFIVLFLMDQLPLLISAPSPPSSKEWLLPPIQKFLASK